jgi:hypothetical protein
MKPFVTLAAMLITFIGYSQTQKQAIPISIKTNQQRYKVDYELKDYVFINGDSSLLNSINIDAIEYQRAQSSDIEIFNSDINQIIVLYSKDKMVLIHNRNNTIHSINQN